MIKNMMAPMIPIDSNIRISFIGLKDVKFSIFIPPLGFLAPYFSFLIFFLIYFSIKYLNL